LLLLVLYHSYSTYIVQVVLLAASMLMKKIWDYLMVKTRDPQLFF